MALAAPRFAETRTVRLAPLSQLSAALPHRHVHVTDATLQPLSQSPAGLQCELLLCLAPRENGDASGGSGGISNSTSNSTGNSTNSTTTTTTTTSNVWVFVDDRAVDADVQWVKGLLREWKTNLQRQHRLSSSVLIQ